ncbi:hypothetical protein GCM10010424_73660 [Streptomyces lienomycini]
MFAQLIGLLRQLLREKDGTPSDLRLPCWSPRQACRTPPPTIPAASARCGATAATASTSSNSAVSTAPDNPATRTHDIGGTPGTPGFAPRIRRTVEHTEVTA